MSSNPIRLKFLFGKYLRNTCSKRELDEFWELMSELSENDLILNELHELWQGQDEDLSIERGELNRVFDRLGSRMQEYNGKFVIKPLKSGRRKYLAVAASIILLMGFGWMQLRKRSAKTSVVSTAVATQLSTRMIILSDGTSVTLNRNSKLEYAFDKNGRQVFLTGEAYFDVKHDAAKPFQVHTGDFVTRVLGTAFNVRAYERDNKVEVTVANGRVQVKKEGEKGSLGTLLPGEQLVIDKKQVLASLVKPDMNAVLKWKSPDFVFDNIRLEDAAVIISRNFGVEFRFSRDALRNCRFTGNLTGKSLEEILSIICDLTRSSWRKSGDSLIVLNGEGCPNQ